MSDPLSIAASLAGLITTAQIVYGGIYNYVRSVRDADKSIKDLVAEVGLLYGILQRLELQARILEEENSLQCALRMEHIYRCGKTLEDIRKILKNYDLPNTQTHSILALRRKLLWPLKVSKTKAFLVDVERHKATMSLALTADNQV